VKSRRSASRKTPARRDARVKRPKAKASAKKDAKKLKIERARAQKLKEAARLKAQKQKEAEREKKLKEAARLKAQKQKEAEQKKKEAARLKAQKQKEAEREKKLKEAARLKEQKQKEVERERARKEAEKQKEKLKKERELQKEREAEEKAKERERLRLEKEAQRQAAEAEKARLKQEREEERERLRLEKEAQREEARRQREEERARREAEREAYRKAKEAERERLRAEKEAARRALEGKVARASRRAQRAGGRGTTTRVYRPEAIPDQSGTTRRVAEGEPGQPKFSTFRFTEASSPIGSPVRLQPPEELAPKPPPPPAPPPPERVEERYAQILQRLGETEEEFRREYTESFDMSWIYHDSALEGTVYTFQELKTAIDPSITVVPDSSLQPVCEEIRRHKAAIDLVRDLADKKRVPLTVDVIKRIYLVLHPEEGDLKSVKYRKDIPQHRLYFHEYAAPDKIAYKVRQIVDWLNGPEPKKIKSPVRIAARAHYDLLRVFPFPLDSGKVARLLMNVILLRAGYPPAIVHSTERQRYYEALKGALPTIVSMVNESIVNALVSIEKRLDERDQKGR